MPPSYTLYTPPGSFRAFAPLIAAELNHVQVIVETENVETIAQLKSPTGQLPILEFTVNSNNSRSKSATRASSEGVIFSSAAIARYIAGLRTDTYLMGKGGFLERGMINQWVDWCGSELELPSCILVYPLIGYMTIPNPEITLQAKNDFTKALQVLQRRLIETKAELPRETKNNLDSVDDPDHETNDDNKDNDGDDTKDWYLLGSNLTLADIVIVATLIYPFQMAFHKDFFVQPQPEQPQQECCSLKEVVEWFERCVQRPEFQAVLGTVEMGSKLAAVSSSSSSSPNVEPTGTTASTS